MLFKVFGHEHIEVSGSVFPERSGRLEPILPIEGVCRLEGRARACFQKKARISTLASRANYMIKNCLPDTTIEEGRARTHGFDLSVEMIQLF